MHRVGADPATLPAWPTPWPPTPGCALGALWTHLAVADGERRRRPGVHRRASSERFDASWPPWPPPGTGPR